MVSTTPKLLIEPRDHPASYVVYYDADTAKYYAKSCIKGGTDYNDPDAVKVMQNALNGLTAGRTWKERVTVKGALPLSTSVAVPSYTVLDLSNAIITSTVGGDMWHMINGIHDVDLLGGIYPGTTSPASTSPIIVQGSDSGGACYNIRIKNPKISGSYAAGVAPIQIDYLFVGGPPTPIPTFYNYNIDVTDFFIDGSQIPSSGQVLNYINTRHGKISGYFQKGGSNLSAMLDIAAYCADLNVDIRAEMNACPDINIQQSHHCNILLQSHNAGNQSLQIYDCANLDVVIHGEATVNTQGQGVKIIDFGASSFDGHTSLYTTGSEEINIHDGVYTGYYSSGLCATNNVATQKNIKFHDNICTGFNYQGFYVGGAGGNVITGLLDVRNNAGMNPLKQITNFINGTKIGCLFGGSSPTLVSAITYTCSGTPIDLYLAGGTVSAMTKNGVAIPYNTTLTVIHLEPGDTFSLTFSVIPTTTVCMGY